MKYLFILWLFAVHPVMQDNYDFEFKTSSVDIYLKGWARHNSSEQGGYVYYKFAALNNKERDVEVFEIPKAQKDKFTLLFRTQYKEWKTAYDEYKKSKHSRAKNEMIKVLIKHEEEFRKLLNDVQKKKYLSYNPNRTLDHNLAFTRHFMNDSQLSYYKKQVM
ncbi:hypothetical protein FMM05_07705 [Flavobacterium zepuense]|uniref:Uncharacterized protein n=1 Tax=Flavobacterium zepuense TaxID=2593302 RepID=A0A552V3Z7_9FLAO|nr:hypothetical protein [Flavobacterium zepuense]TRW25182.1 hypothetical protein FMM05_07705 [Flavobacterium zepuense]